MTFIEWLKQQKGRNDLIGDLAKSEATLEALERAWAEVQSTHQEPV